MSSRSSSTRAFVSLALLLLVLASSASAKGWLKLPKQDDPSRFPPGPFPPPPQIPPGEASKYAQLLEQTLQQQQAQQAQAKELAQNSFGSAPGGGVNGGVVVGGRYRIEQVDFGDAAMAFLPAFLASISMIIVSELGDKTFFIAAIMAMKHSRLTVFTAAAAALALMTVLSSIMGLALPVLIPKSYTHYAASVLFLVFGVMLLKEAYELEDGQPNEELEEVEGELDKKELEGSSVEMEALETGKAKSPAPNAGFFSPVFVQCFTMTFLAEWGDRSQIATIAMAAAKDPVGVTVGGIIGHCLCTGLAVLGGKLLATRISEKTVATVGGLLFLFFAVHSFMAEE